MIFYKVRWTGPAREDCSSVEWSLRLPESMQMFVSWRATARAPQCWGMCLTLDTAGSKRKRKGLGVYCLGIHARDNVVIGCAPLKSSIWELLVSCFVGFVLWFGFLFLNFTLDWESYITTISAHPHQQRWHSYRERRANQGCCLPRIIKKNGLFRGV